MKGSSGCRLLAKVVRRLEEACAASGTPAALTLQNAEALLGAIRGSLLYTARLPPQLPSRLIEASGSDAPSVERKSDADKGGGLKLRCLQCMDALVRCAEEDIEHAVRKFGKRLHH